MLKSDTIAKISPLLILILLGIVNGCSKDKVQAVPLKESKEQTVFEYNRHIGWIHGRCLAIKRADLHKGAVVQIVTLTSPQQVVKSAVTDVATSDSGCLALLPDRSKINQKKGRSFYMLELPPKTEFMAIALLDYEGELLSKDDMIHIDLNHDGNQETAYSCQTSEGLKFFLTSIHEPGSTPIWSDYYYLGYDTKPTCQN